MGSGNPTQHHRSPLGLHRDTVTKITTAAEDLITGSQRFAPERSTVCRSSNERRAAPMPPHAHAKFADALAEVLALEARELQRIAKPASTPQI